MASNEEVRSNNGSNTCELPVVGKEINAIPDSEYLTGWRVMAVGISIVLSMFLVRDQSSPNSMMTATDYI